MEEPFQTARCPREQAGTLHPRLWGHCQQLLDQEVSSQWVWVEVQHHEGKREKLIFRSQQTLKLGRPLSFAFCFCLWVWGFVFVLFCFICFCFAIPKALILSSHVLYLGFSFIVSAFGVPLRKIFSTPKIKEIFTTCVFNIAIQL